MCTLAFDKLQIPSIPRKHTSDCGCCDSTHQLMSSKSRNWSSGDASLSAASSPSLRRHVCSGGGAPNNRPLKMAVLLGVGTLFCSVPISWACFLALQPPGTA